MGVRTQLDLSEFVAALESVLSVVEDHRAALDRLDRGEEWADDVDDSAEDPVDDRHDTEDTEDTDGRMAAVVEPTARHAGRAAGSELCRILDAVLDAGRSVTSFPALGEVLSTVPRAMASGAPGHQIADVLAGLAEALRNTDRLDGERLAIGLELAAERVAVDDDGSHAGCLPSVVGVAADAALGALDQGAELAEVLLAAADEGLVELESGPRSNPSLESRGVVDATAAGFLLVLDVLASVVTGDPLPVPPADPVAASGSTSAGTRFVVRCLVEPHEDGGGAELDARNWLESCWYELGDLAVFDAGQVPWRVELHTTLPGPAIEAIHEVGRPRELHVGLSSRGG